MELGRSPCGVADFPLLARPIRVPSPSKSVVEQDVEWALAVQQLEQKEWRMWSLLNDGGVHVTSPQEDASIVEDNKQSFQGVPAVSPVRESDSDETCFFEFDL